MTELEKYRLEMEEITSSMLELLEKRLDLSKKVASYKRENNMPIFQPEREQALIDKYVKEGEYQEATRDFLVKLFDLSKEVQKEENAK